MAVSWTFSDGIWKAHSDGIHPFRSGLYLTVRPDGEGWLAGWRGDWYAGPDDLPHPEDCERFATLTEAKRAAEALAEDWRTATNRVDPARLEATLAAHAARRLSGE